MQTATKMRRFLNQIGDGNDTMDELPNVQTAATWLGCSRLSVRLMAALAAGALPPVLPPDERHAWVSLLAHELWLYVGRPEGRTLTHWLLAEARYHALYEQPLDTTTRVLYYTGETPTPFPVTCELCGYHMPHAGICQPVPLPQGGWAFTHRAGSPETGENTCVIAVAPEVLAVTCLRCATINLAVNRTPNTATPRFLRKNVAELR